MGLSSFKSPELEEKFGTEYDYKWGFLRVNDCDKWEIFHPYDLFEPIQLSSGNCCEIQLYNHDKWLPTRVEYDHDRRSYYFIHAVEIYSGSLESYKNVIVRI